MSKLSLILLIILTSSCAKLSYMTSQGIGHLSLEWNGEENNEVLKDPKVKPEHKRKIRLISEYKNFFYKYFNRPKTDIYTQTTFLKDRAVTYLVIASSKKRIKAIEHSFPFVGTFPYRGFFSEKSADEYIRELEADNLSTYKREVYAYSTLDRTPFDDNILSSFFYYNDEGLAHLIFHELTHTIFFIDGEVGLNESLAEVIATELSQLYFKKTKKDIAKKQMVKDQNKKLNQLISKLSKRLDQIYVKSKEPVKVLNTFIDNVFKPEVKKLCEGLKVKNCWPLKGVWNNARFAAFGTYQDNQNTLERIKAEKQLSAKELLSYLQKKYAIYQDSDKKISFEQWLNNKK